MSWVVGRAASPVGDIPRVAARLDSRDRWGAVRVRWGFGRMRYRIPPGLYAAGNPDPSSPVLVTANYKLTFDALRRELGGVDAWLLVLDTRGINVWCAAGKGTFGTQEIIDRVTATGLAKAVKHRKLIVPQLGAPGTAAHEVQGKTGFRVVYGPVRAADLPAFLAGGLRATSDMRRVRFGFLDRARLAGMELRVGFKYLLALLALAALGGILFFGRLHPFDFVPYLGAYLMGSGLTPLLLPWIPGRAFALKGALAGLLWAAILMAGGRAGFLPAFSWKQEVVHLLLLPALSAFLAMNFTGSSTFTSLSGVLKEMRTAVPLIGVTFLAGVIFYAIKLLVPF
ncbi:MAG: acetyl-CoA synthase subunit gamma [Candidatus Aminicenantes bacterium]|nr:acetyl-CoA synthase subunit gamma [Candidatus Aminicenantes bacterium]